MLRSLPPDDNRDLEDDAENRRKFFDLLRTRSADIRAGCRELPDYQRYPEPLPVQFVAQLFWTLLLNGNDAALFEILADRIDEFVQRRVDELLSIHDREAA